MDMDLSFPGRYFYTNYTQERDKNVTTLPHKWLDINLGGDHEDDWILGKEISFILGTGKYLGLFLNLIYLLLQLHKIEQ